VAREVLREAVRQVARQVAGRKTVPVEYPERPGKNKVKNQKVKVKLRKWELMVTIKGLFL
jgi:hypothetical protein